MHLQKRVFGSVCSADLTRELPLLGVHHLVLDLLNLLDKFFIDVAFFLLCHKATNDVHLFVLIRLVENLIHGIIVFKKVSFWLGFFFLVAVGWKAALSIFAEDAGSFFVFAFLIVFLVVEVFSFSFKIRRHFQLILKKFVLFHFLELCIHL